MVKLEEYLSGLREEGTDLGDGQFSLNPESAKGRLAHFKLLREMEWASLLVQSAVRWNCSKLEIVQTRYLTRFLIPLETLDLPTKEELLQALSRIDLAPQTGLGKFVTAVQILLHQGLLPFQVKICQSGQAETLAYGELAWFDRFRRHPDNALLVDINHCKPLSESLYPAFLAKKEQMAIRKEVEIYGTPSPVPIIFDGHELAGQFGPPEPDDLGQRVLLGLQLLAQPKSRLKNLPLPHALQKAIQNDSNSLLVATRIQGFSSLSLRIPAKTEDEHDPPLVRRCYLAWVQAGVVIERLPLPFGSKVLCLDLYLSGEGLETDLSGSQLIRNEALEQRQQNALRELQQVLQSYKNEIPTDAELSATETRDHKDNHPVIGTALFLTIFAPMMAVGTLLSIFLLPHVGIPMVGAGWLGYKHQPFKVDDEELLKRCRLLLEQDLEQFLKFLKD